MEVTGSGLKLFGAFSMLLDHIGVAVIERGILKSGNSQMMKLSKDGYDIVRGNLP